MPNFLKLLRRRPLSEKGAIEKRVEEVTTFINRELLPFLQEFRDSTQSSDDEDDEDIETLQNEPFVTTSASTTLTNESVATNSTEILPTASAGVITWAINTASVVFAKLQDLAGMSVLGRATNSSGVMAAITATGANQALRTNESGDTVLWESYLPTVHLPVSISGTHSSYLLPATFRSGDTVRLTITGNTIFNGIAMSDGSQPVEGMSLILCLSDQSGGSAPGFTLSLVDIFNAGGAPNGQFRTPGQVQGTVPGPSYVMQSEEEACLMVMQNVLWRLVAGTAAQAITGDIAVSSGNGSTRDSQINPGVIVNADVNASAAIALSKLATQAANTVVANATAGVAVPTAVSVGTNTVLGRVAGNITAALLVDAQVSALAAIQISKLANGTALSVVGNATNGSATHTDIAAVAASGAVLRESGSTIGFGTISSAGLANDSVTDAILRNSGALSVIGRSANSSGDPADISASAASGAVLRESGSVLGFGTVATAGIANNAVTLAKLATQAQRTVIGVSNDAGTVTPTALTENELGQIIHHGTQIFETSASTTFNDYSPTGWQTAKVILITGNSNVFTGAARPDESTDSARLGDFKIFINGNGLTQTFNHNDTGSTSTNRFFNVNGAAFSLGSRCCVAYQYQFTSSGSGGSSPRWHMTYHSRLDSLGSTGAEVLVTSSVLAGITTQTFSIDTAAASKGVVFCARVTFTASGAGAPRDIDIFGGVVPKLQKINAYLKLTTPIALATWEIRTATGGGGTLISPAAIPATVAGTIFDNDDQVRDLALGTSAILRLSDGGIEGTIVFEWVKT